MKTILVAGGAGYIGSHMVALLAEKGYDVVVVDNLRTGHWQAVKGARKLYVGDLRDAAFLDQVFSENDIDGVINFAAYSLVGESVTNPLKYYGNNVAGSQSMLTAMKEHGVNKIVFSSTAATYGEPEKQPIEENDRTDPTNPYGATKLAIEGMLKWCDKAYGIHYVALRYFNAAGSNPDAGIGEDHDPESHLIPLVMKTALGQRSHIGIFGDDYPTADGTCIRDYIHVVDLAKGHVAAMEYAMHHTGTEIFNLGTGKGVSVTELVETFEQVNGVAVPHVYVGRRAGDLAECYANADKARRVLGWQAERSIADMCRDSWNWQKNNPNGYSNEKPL